MEEKNNRRIARLTADIIKRIQNDKATLANIRNARDLSSRNASLVWAVLFEAMESHDLSEDGTPTRAEQAVFSALHFYAAYQQGKSQVMVGTTPVFKALAKLRQDERVQVALDRRAANVFGSHTFLGVQNSLSHLLAILKSKMAEPLDFASFAQDLYDYQQNTDKARQVCLTWGQQYYTTNAQQKGDNQNEE